MIYSFVNNQLASAQYLFNDVHSNYNDYISDYNQLKALLENKYGKSTQDDEKWTATVSHNIDKGMAIGMGYLTYLSIWETPATNIYLMLFGDNFDFNFSLSYKSKQLTSKEKERDQTKEMDNL